MLRIQSQLVDSLNKGNAIYLCVSEESCACGVVYHFWITIVTHAGGFHHHIFVSNHIYIFALDFSHEIVLFKYKRGATPWERMMVLC